MSRYVDFEKQLNPSQFEAVSVGEGPVLVVAGAGSGKTRTIVYRVAWLVNKGVPPSGILLMTFTRKAAQEMLSRASDLIQTELWDVAGGNLSFNREPRPAEVRQISPIRSFVCDHGSRRYHCCLGSHKKKISAAPENCPRDSPSREPLQMSSPARPGLKAALKTC